MAVVKYTFLLLKCWIHYLFVESSKYKSAFETLFNGYTFSLNKVHSKSPILVVKYLAKALKRVFDSNTVALTRNNKSHVALLNGSKKHEKTNIEYVESITNSKISVVLNREKFTCLNLFDRLLLIILMLLVSPFLVFVSFVYSSRKSNLSLMLYNIPEHISLYDYSKTEKIKTFYFTGCSYENDANIISLFFEYIDVLSCKVSSANPLTYYTHVVAHSFIFSSPFQQEQYDKSDTKSKWFVNKFELWPCLHYNKFIEYYRDITPVDNEKTIGFISFGAQQRINQGDTTEGFEEFDSEFILMNLLRKFISDHEYKLLIYLHPCEKKDYNHYNEMIVYYQKYFDDNNIEFVDYDMPSWKSYSMSNVAISVYSSANIERLFCGFKTLYAPIGMSNLPYKNSSLDNICISDEASFENMLIETIEMSEDDFFSKNNLLKYRFKDLDLFKE